MPANVKEAAQHVVAAADNNDRLSSDLACYVLSGIGHLIDATRKLPRSREDSLPLDIINAIVRVPGRRNCGGFLERRVRVVAVQNVSQCLVHASKEPLKRSVSQVGKGACPRSCPEQ